MTGHAEDCDCSKCAWIRGFQEAERLAWLHRVADETDHTKCGGVIEALDAKIADLERVAEARLVRMNELRRFAPERRLRIAELATELQEHYEKWREHQETCSMDPQIVLADKARLQELAATVDSLSQLREDQAQLICELEAKVEVAEGKSNADRLRLGERDTYIDELRQIRINQSQEIQRLEAQLAAHKVTITNLKADKIRGIDELTDHLENHETTLKMDKKYMDEQRAHIAGLEAKVQELKPKTPYQCNNCDNLNTIWRNDQERIRNLQARISELEQWNQDEQDQHIEDLETTVRVDKGYMDKQHIEIKALELRIAASSTNGASEHFVAKVKEQEERMADLVVQVRDYQADLAEANTRNENLSAELTSNTRDRQAAYERVADLETELSDFRDGLADNQSGITITAAFNRGYRTAQDSNQIPELRTEIKKLEAVNREQAEGLENLEANVAILESATERQMNRIKELEIENQDLIDLIAKKETEVTETRTLWRNEETKLNSTLNTIAELRATIEDLNMAGNGDLKYSRDWFKRSSEDMQRAINRLEDENQDLQDSLLAERTTPLGGTYKHGFRKQAKKIKKLRKLHKSVGWEESGGVYCDHCACIFPCTDAKILGLK